MPIVLPKLYTGSDWRLLAAEATMRVVEREGFCTDMRHILGVVYECTSLRYFPLHLCPDAATESMMKRRQTAFLFPSRQQAATCTTSSPEHLVIVDLLIAKPFFDHWSQGQTSPCSTSEISLFLLARPRCPSAVCSRIVLGHPQQTSRRTRRIGECNWQSSVEGESER